MGTAEPPSMTHHLFIVSREAPAVARFLAEQFPRDSDVSVVLDRRDRERRRTHAEVDAELLVRSHALLTLADAER